MTPSSDQFSQMPSWTPLFPTDLKVLPPGELPLPLLSSAPQLSMACIPVTATYLITVLILQSLWNLYKISCSKLTSDPQISLEQNQNSLIYFTKNLVIWLLPSFPASLTMFQLYRELSILSLLELCTGCSLHQKSSVHHLSLHLEKPHLTSPRAPARTPQQV